MSNDSNIVVYFPHLQIIARASDLGHVFALLEKGVHVYERETFEGALLLDEQVLKQLGFTAWRAKQTAHRFRAHDQETVQELNLHYHEDFEVRVKISTDARNSIRKTMESDEDHLSPQADHSWQQIDIAVSKNKK
jgi:glutathione-regulated potassium-efflux system ancillary protein KefC